jgi:hypothetical protein
LKGKAKEKLFFFVEVVSIFFITATVSHSVSYWAKSYGVDNNSDEIIEPQIQQTSYGGYIFSPSIPLTLLYQ